MVAQVVDHFGKLDIAVGNAAFSDREPFVEANMDGFRRTIDVTMWGAFYLTRAAARRDDSTGQSAAPSSWSVRRMPPFRSPERWPTTWPRRRSRPWPRRRHWSWRKHQIRVNVIQPGWIDTPGERKYATEEALEAGRTADSRWDGWERPKKLPSPILFLCDPRNEYTTGATLLVDGGISLPWWAGRCRIAQRWTSESFLSDPDRAAPRFRPSTPRDCRYTKMKYLLPCSCGKTVTVDVGQAGQSLRCECGRKLEVPTMRAIRQLEPLRDVQLRQSRRKKPWSLTQGAVFASGLAIMVAGLATAAYFQIGRSRLQTEAVPWDNLELALKNIDNMNIDQAFQLWQEIRDDPIGPYHPPNYIMARYVSAGVLNYVLGSLGVAALGLIVLLSAFLLSPRKKQAAGKRPAAKLP